MSKLTDEKVTKMSAVKTGYKCWTAEQRNESYKLTKKAITDGKIPHPSKLKCAKCGRGKNEVYRMDYHNQNYNDPIKYLVPLCSGCHLKLHRQLKQKLVKK